MRFLSFSVLQERGCTEASAASVNALLNKILVNETAIEYMYAYTHMYICTCTWNRNRIKAAVFYMHEIAKVVFHCPRNVFHCQAS